MVSSSSPKKYRPMALAVAGTGLAGVLAFTGGGAEFLAQVAAKTIIVVGGASDPTGQDQWKRISGDYTGPAPVFVQYPAVFGVGYPGLALSSDGKHTYQQSNDIGANATVDAINAAKTDPDEEVVVYTISQGADVVGLAVIRYGKDHPRPSDGSAKLTFIEQGSPSFVRSGAWSVIPAGIPGLHNGPVRNDGASGATVVSICVKGDIGCAMGLNPVSALVYLVPGFMMHGAVYTAEDIGAYSPRTGEPFTPGSTPATPIDTRTELRDGREITVETYADGTVKRTWTEDNTTWVSIDKGENPWGWMLRRNGIDVPRQFDQVLNTLIPVPEPGETGLVPKLPTMPSFAPAPPEASPATGRHSADRPDAIPVAQLLTGPGTSSSEPTTTSTDSETDVPVSVLPEVGAPSRETLPTPDATPAPEQRPEKTPVVEGAGDPASTDPVSSPDTKGQDGPVDAHDVPAAADAA